MRNSSPRRPQAAAFSTDTRDAQFALEQLQKLATGSTRAEFSRAFSDATEEMVAAFDVLKGAVPLDQALEMSRPAYTPAAQARRIANNSAAKTFLKDNPDYLQPKGFARYLGFRGEVDAYQAGALDYELRQIWLSAYEYTGDADAAQEMN